MSPIVDRPFIKDKPLKGAQGNPGILAVHFARNRMVAPFRAVIDGLAMAMADGASPASVVLRAAEAGAERATGVYLAVLSSYGLDQGEWGELGRELGRRPMLGWLRERALSPSRGKVEKEARCFCCRIPGWGRRGGSRCGPR